MDALPTLPLRIRLRVRPLLAIGVFALGVPLVLAGCGSGGTNHMRNEIATQHPTQ